MILMTFSNNINNIDNVVNKAHIAHILFVRYYVIVFVVTERCQGVT